MKWYAEDGNYRYTIEEMFDGRVDLTIDFLGDCTYLWFGSYAAARRHVREHCYFTGRFKKVEE